jgi:YHS domain-containing protein
VAAEAKRGEFLVTDSIRAGSLGLGSVTFRAAGMRQMKGMAGDFELYEVLSTSDPASTRHLDPVCRMELTIAHATTRLTWRGLERYFCSDECLQRFVDSPESYCAAST